MLQKQGQMTEDGMPASRRPSSASGAANRRPVDPNRPGLGKRMANYFAEVKIELAKVLWPKKQETVSYAKVVLVTLVLITLLIFALDYGFTKLVSWLFQ
jgi:preprotein translocase subunit SecE